MTTAAEALIALAEALAAQAAQAQAEGDDASSRQWALCCFSRAEAFRRARSMAIELATKLPEPPPEEEPNSGYEDMLDERRRAHERMDAYWTPSKEAARAV